jgi:glucose-6-phosphate isomerase
MPDYRRRAAREAMSVRLDVNGMMAEAIGQAGVAEDEVETLTARGVEAAHALQVKRAAGELPLYELPYQEDALATTKALAAEVRAECETLVVLGIGGWSLGTKTLLGALETTRRIVVADNIDPSTFGALLDGLDLNRTAFNVISKSGDTAETMAQFLIVRDLLLRQLGAVEYTKHVVITTDADAGALRQIVHDEGFRALDVPAGVGGRFSVLTAVGLFPAAVAGIRVDDLLAGAAWMDSRCQDAKLWQSPAHLLAALLHLADTRHRQNIVALMPYADRLHPLAAWFAQLWAETLGKTETINGTPVHVGQTPLAAVGATDQHSLLQLFVEGPVDKVVIMLRVEDHGREIPIPAAYTDFDSIGYLGGTGLGQLLNREQRATELALVQQQRPVITISLPQINPFTLGQLFYLFEVAAAFAAALYRVNPLDQPGVQASKRLTFGQMGRGGFADERAAVEAWVARKRGEYIL